MPEQVRVVFNDVEFARLRRDPRIRKYLRDVTEPVQRQAVASAPRSPHGNHGRPPGYLKSQIRVRSGESVEGPWARVTTEARAPDGFRYGVYHQRRRPYIRPTVSLIKG